MEHVAYYTLIRKGDGTPCYFVSGSHGFIWYYWGNEQPRPWNSYIDLRFVKCTEREGLDYDGDKPYIRPRGRIYILLGEAIDRDQ